MRTKKLVKIKFFSIISGKLKKIFLACPQNNYQPRVYNANFLFSLFIGLVFLRLFILPFYFYFPQSNFFAEVVSGEIVEFLNLQRADLGIETLNESPQLVQAATLKAQDMLDNDYFSHTSPEGVTPWHWFEEVGYEYRIAGENLAIGFLDSVEVHQAWNASGAHRQNLLDQRFEEIGVAVLTGDFEGRETTIVVQLFGAPRQEISSPVAVVPSETNPNTGEHVLSLGSDEEAVAVEDIEPEEILPVSLGVESVIRGAAKQSFSAKLSQFFVESYDAVIGNVIFSITAVLIIIFFLNLYLLFKSKLSKGARMLAIKNLASGVLPVIGVLILLGLADKPLLIRFIPHRLRI